MLLCAAVGDDDRVGEDSIVVLLLVGGTYLLPAADAVVEVGDELKVSCGAAAGADSPLCSLEGNEVTGCCCC